MFYYISFLRPPPLRASAEPTESILITPQICNDLRTEYCDGPTDIYYAWSLHTSHSSLPIITKPTKLTSWRTSTAYKEIPVPRPPFKAQKDPAGTSWRLILTCGTTHDDRVVVLGETDTTGKMPLSVISMPVAFPRQSGTGNKNALKGAKQERIARSYALHVSLREAPIVFEITEQISFDLDKKVWDSGIGLSSWLVRLFSGKNAEHRGPLSDLRESLFGTDARHILELGAGTGIVAITLAVLRSTLDLSDQSGSIVATDLPPAIPILQDNVTSNQTLMNKCTPQAAIFDWEQDQLPPPVQAQLEAGLDVIVMADVTYNTASFSSLIRTLSQLIHLCKRRRNGCPPRVLMGYKERHSDERSLWGQAKDVDVHFQQIAKVSGAGGNPVEIWLG